MKEKQIEEMAKTMCFSKEHCTVKSCVEVNCETTWLAENLYNAGYRKASEVAKDIFAEINELKKQYARGDIDGNTLYVYLYAIEKKYTEEVKK